MFIKIQDQRTGLWTTFAPACRKGLAGLCNLSGETCRERGYAYQTEKTYCLWIKRFIRLHGNRRPEAMGAQEINACLRYLATRYNCSPGTQRRQDHGDLHPRSEAWAAGRDQPFGRVGYLDWNPGLSGSNGLALAMPSSATPKAIYTSFSDENWAATSTPSTCEVRLRPLKASTRVRTKG